MGRSRHRPPSDDVTEPVSVGRLVSRFALAGVACLALVITVTAYASRRVGTDQAIADAERVTWVSVRGIVEPVLDDAVFELDRTALDELDRAVRGSVLQGSLVRVKIWDRDGTIVYSDEPRLIGEQFDLGEDKLAVFAGGEPQAEVSDLSEPENRYETESKLLEVYQLAETTSGTPVLFEAYFRYSGVAAVGRDLWLQFAPIAIGALVLLQLVQIPVAWSLARRLRAGQIDRERWLRHAIDASDLERRRIAADLHDGVVQDLTGVSLGLVALGRSETVERGQVLDASAAIRTGIKSLRSLLVEIYPPNLHDEGLESALGDLLGRLAARGVRTELAVDLDGVTIDRDVTTLLYRAAHEALRNVNAHAAAGRVEVRLAPGGVGRVRLTVADDGRGFSPQDISASGADGHVGLRTLGDLVGDVGGTLEIRSARGAGTTVVVDLPVQGRGAR